MRGTKPQLVVDNAPVGTTPDGSIPAAPEYFGEHARAEWQRIMPLIIERGVINDADMGSVENYCIAQGTVREFQAAMAKALGPDTKAKHFRSMNQAMQTARQLAAELGLTPVSRARPPKKPRPGAEGENPLDIS